MDKITNKTDELKEFEKPASLTLEDTVSSLDEILKDCPAQYASDKLTPTKKWSEVATTLKDLDTSKVHYVKPPENHIVIDFDLKNEKGEKDAARNLEAASKWPPTYAEFSQGGNGVHLHYIYEGDPGSLSRIYDDGIEVKVFNGNASLRRKVSKCINLPIASISAGLLLKEKKPVINYNTVITEKSLRAKIEKALNREYEANSHTKPAIDLIYKFLEDAYASGCPYDVTDMRPRILAFANNSTHNSSYCVTLVSKMKFKSEDAGPPSDNYEDDRLVFFDLEVFPNLLLVNWKYDGAEKCVRMINPSPTEVAELFKYRLVGFNCRRYDNHILYARYLGYDNHQLFMLSQKLINNSKNATFSEAYNISYTDVLDFAAAVNKKSLKKFEVELRIHHQELGLPWDEDVPEDKWDEVAEYCDNDVISTEAVFHHLKGDWVARQILAELSGLTVNDTTNQHATRIVFGTNKTPQNEFMYRDLSEPVTSMSDEVREYYKENTSLPLNFIPPSRDGQTFEPSILPYFPGYKFDNGKSIYRGIEVGEGGEVYAEPGIYYDVALLDVESMHPSSIEDECLFGPKYTKIFSEIKKARVYIKHEDIEGLKTVLNGKLVKFAERAQNGEFSFSDLATAMKTVINSVYGLTSASFAHPFRDPRNKDNIVAKRGALFMVDLIYAVQEKGFTVAHVKTDSIKIPNATPEIIKFAEDFAHMYGYNFKHEATYEKMCLINDAVYIAKGKWGDHAGEWTPTGARFAHPYVFKTLFTKQKIELDDLYEVKSVQSGYIYLDFNEGYPDVQVSENLKATLMKSYKKNPESVSDYESEISRLDSEIALGHNYTFVGKTGLFVPIKPGCGGGRLVRYDKDSNKYDSVTGAKDYRWAEAEVIAATHKENNIDMSYFRALVDDAIDKMSKFGDVYAFLEDTPVDPSPPWCLVDDCSKCPDRNNCDSLPAAFKTKGEQ